MAKWDDALDAFMSVIRMPAPDTTLEEWLAKERSFKPHPGQHAVMTAFQTPGVHIIDVVAGKRGGKCLAKGTLVLMADGSRKTIEAIVPGEKVFCLDDKLKIISGTVTNVFPTGRQKVFRLTTSTGRSLLLTCNHPLFSSTGWRPLNEFDVGDWMAVPRTYPRCGTKTADEKEMSLLGYLVGDGSLTRGTPGFTNVDAKIIEHLTQCLPDKVTLVRDGKCGYLLSIGRHGGQVPNSVSQMLNRYSAHNKLSRDKRVPLQLFSLSNEALAPFLRALFSCDGTVDDRGRIEIVLASEGLIDDIQHLLLRYSIVTRKRYKAAKCNGKVFDSWRLSIGNAHSITTYAKEIGFTGEKAEKLDKTLIGTIGHRMDRNDLVPLFPIQSCYEALGERPWRQSYSDKIGYDKVRNARLENVARKNCQILADHFDIGYDLAYSDIYWDKIRTIEAVDTTETWDISVEGNHNFLAQDIFVHNSEIVRQIALYCVTIKALRVWVLGPTWDVVDRIFRPLWYEVTKAGIKIVDKQKESRMIRTAGGGLLEGISWAAPEQIEGEGVQVIITDESQELTRYVADKIQARLVGDWKWIRIGSPNSEGMSFYEEDAIEQELQKMPSHVGPVSWPSEMNPNWEVQEAVRIEKENLKFLEEKLGKESIVYRQRKRRYDSMYGGVSVPSQNVAIGTFDKDIHVRECAFDEDVDVYLGIDPGYYPGYYAIAVFQPHPLGDALDLINEESANKEELWQIDEIYVQHMVTDQVIDLCRDKPWWKNVTKAVIDVAARQSNRQTGKSDLMVWQSKTKFPILAERVTIDDGLNTHRRWLANNRLFIDEKSCPNTLKEYVLYKMKDKHHGDSKEVPLDRNNHLLKASAYLLCNIYGFHDGIKNVVSWKRVLSAPMRMWS